MTERRPAHGLLRGLRAAVLGGVSLALGTGAHIAGGGGLPSVGILAVAGLVLGMVAVAVTARRCRFGFLLAVLTAEQAALHVVLAAAGHAPVAASGVHHTSVLNASAEPMAADPGMWIAHLAATALIVWVLARGEARLWALADRILHAASVRPSRRRPRPRVRTIVSPSLGPLGGLLHVATPRRGPPETFASV